MHNLSCSLKCMALAENQAVLVPLEEERPSATGDVVVVNYQSFVGDEPLEGGEADNVEVELGKGQVQEEIRFECAPGLLLAALSRVYRTVATLAGVDPPGLPPFLALHQ